MEHPICYDQFQTITFALHRRPEGVDLLEELACQHSGTLSVNPFRSGRLPIVEGDNPLALIAEPHRDSPPFFVMEITGVQHINVRFNCLPSRLQPSLEQMRWLRARCQCCPSDANDGLQLLAGRIFVVFFTSVATSYCYAWVHRPRIQPQHLRMVVKISLHGVLQFSQRLEECERLD